MSNSTHASVCTYCGKSPAEVGPLTGDHAIPVCTWVGESQDRSIKVKGCKRCNGCADEGLLKTFLAVFDNRLVETRLQHFRHPKGKTDFRRFLAACSKAPELRAYATEEVTAIFKKMFMGLRRHLLKAEWTYLPEACFGLSQVEKLPVQDAEGVVTVLRPWPLQVGGPNDGFVCPPAFVDDFESCDFSFRDFAFGIFDYVDPDNMAMCLKYRGDGADSASRLHLLCGVWGAALLEEAPKAEQP